MTKELFAAEHLMEVATIGVRIQHAVATDDGAVSIHTLAWNFFPVPLLQPPLWLLWAYCEPCKAFYWGNYEER